jgi:hypothetical protein
MRRGLPDPKLSPTLEEQLVDLLTNYEIDWERITLPFGEPSVRHLPGDAWQRYLFDPSASSDVDALTETAESVLEALTKYGPTGVSLIGLDEDNVQSEHLATILRTTYKWRSQIPGWNASLVVAAAALKRAGISPADALFGLDK